jgi:ornithine cyclodeaminase
MRLPPSRALELVRSAIFAPGREEDVEIPRTVHGFHEVLLGIMGGYSDGALVVKVFSAAPPTEGLSAPRIQGAVLAFDSGTGALRAVIDGPTVTGLRTAALAGVATDLLARRDATEFLMVGAGDQAPYQIDAVMLVRSIKRLKLWSRHRSRAEALGKAVQERYPSVEVRVVQEVSAEARSADIITLATASRTPLLHRSDVGPHCHVNAIGAFEPDSRELASDLVAEALIFVDTLEGCLREAGDLLIPIREGMLGVDEIRSLREANQGLCDRLTVFKSVGSGVFDAACVAWLCNSGDEPTMARDGGVASCGRVGAE